MPDLIATAKPALISPLRAIRLTETDKQRIYEAWQFGMAKCMREFGFVFEPVDYQTANPEYTMATDFATASVRGYHLPPGAEELPKSPNDQKAAADQAFHRALFGDGSSSTDGCRGTVFDKVYDERGEFFRVDQVLGQAEVDATSEIASGGGMIALKQSWSACMAKQGFDYADPSQPLSLFAGQPTVTEREVDVRLADLGCRAEVQYDYEESHMLSDALDSWMQANPAVVTDYGALKSAYLQRLVSFRESIGLPG